MFTVRTKDEIVAFLDGALSEATAGNISGLAIVMLAGGDRISLKTIGDLNGGAVAGLQYLSSKIADAIFNKPSNISLPGGRLPILGEGSQ